MDDFDAIVEGIDIGTPDDVVDYTTMSKLELATLLADIKQEILDRRETVYPRTERGRELHSQYNAVLAALRKKQRRA